MNHFAPTFLSLDAFFNVSSNINGSFTRPECAYSQNITDATLTICFLSAYSICFSELIYFFSHNTQAYMYIIAHITTLYVIKMNAQCRQCNIRKHASVHWLRL